MYITVKLKNCDVTSLHTAVIKAFKKNFAALLQCRVLNHVTWKIVAEHNHSHTVDSPSVVIKLLVTMN